MLLSRITILLIMLSSQLFAQPTAQRIKYNFNSDWKVFIGDITGAEVPEFSDESWKHVTVPYSWNEDEAFAKDIATLSTGIAWYRKHFKLPEEDKGKKIFIEFEGIRQAGDFYVNGKHIGLHENGITAFGFDITELVKTGNEDNVIAARIDNDWNYREKATNQRFQWEDKNFNANYGGICKNAFLHVTHKVYQTLPLYSSLGTTGVYVYADSFNVPGRRAVVHAESEIRNETIQPQSVNYNVEVYDLNEKLVKTFSGESAFIPAGATRILKASSPVTGLNFWSWGYGYLYHVKTLLILNGKPVDVVSTKTGFRKTEFRDGMIYLNDRVIMIHGYAQRTSNEWPAIGMAVPPWLSDYSNQLMVESGGNLVRWMHIAPWKQDIESCDRVGLMQSMPAGDAERDVDGVRWEQRKAVMRDAIIYNKNNPSILFYESGNAKINERHMQEMVNIRNQYDPHGGRASGCREMLNSQVAEYGGEMLYTNKSAGKPLWAMEYSRDEGSRKFWDDYSPPYHKDGDGRLPNDQSAASYNRNMDSHTEENVRRWYEFWLERPGTGRRVSSGGVNIIFSETNTHHRGMENYRRSGEVDALRIKKQNYYAHAVMWNGWVDAEQPGIHIVGHWNYAAGVKKDLYVISTANKVELKVNGHSIGFGEQSNRFLFTFKNVDCRPGTIKAVGYDLTNKKVCSTLIKTTGPPAALRLTTIPKSADFVADGQDISLVEVEVTDAAGNRCPTALHMIHFTLDGSAVWRGGMAQGPGNYILAKELPVEGGVNRVLIRSTTQSGTITLKASATGLKPATLILNSKAFPVTNGLSRVLPSEALPCHLERGPTPLTPSYKMTRMPIAIAAATAGANAGAAFASYDDNELTDWVNNGELSTAWIEYSLQSEATLREVTLKLNNFRSRVYPLIITVDGKEVFRGNTSTSLGYFTAICKPQKGKKVRIRLSAALTNQAQEKGVEVSGKKLDDGVVRDDSKARGTLSIIEAEMYEAMP